MTATQLLLDMKATHAARQQYARAAERLFEQAHDLAARGWRDWALETARLAVMVRRDARGEYDRVRR